MLKSAVCLAACAFFAGVQAQAACTDSPPYSTWADYSSMSTAHIADFGETSIAPFGRTQRITIAGVSDEALRYRVYTVDRGTIAQEPAPVERAHLIKVVRSANDTVEIYFRVDRTAPPEATAKAMSAPSSLGGFWQSVTDRNRRYGDYAFLVVGCRPEGGAAQQVADASGQVVPAAVIPPVLFATGEYTFSTKMMGNVWAGFAVLASALALGIAYTANRKHQNVGRYKAFRMIFAGPNYRLSLSKFQLIFFSAAVAIAVAYFYGRTGSLTELSTDVLLLLGISAGSAATAAYADQSKNRLSWGNWIWLRDQGVLPTPGSAKMEWFELVSTNGELDPARFQALVFTLIIAPTFLITSLYDLASAEIPVSLLYVLGLSQAAYIAGKIVSPPTMHDLDKEITGLRQLIEAGTEPPPSRWQAVQSSFEAAFGHDWRPFGKQDPASVPDGRATT